LKEEIVACCPTYGGGGRGVEAMIRLRLKPGREVSVARRHPWLFSGAVASQEEDGSDGHAEVVDSDGEPLARGSYSPGSQILARLWTFDGRAPDKALFRERFEAARRLRAAIMPPETSGFRAINSEGDLCPGVLMDIYGEQPSSSSDRRRQRGAELTAAARDVFSPPEISSATREPPRRDVGARPAQNPNFSRRKNLRFSPFPSPRTDAALSPTALRARRPASISISATTEPACGPSPGAGPS
jgi:hypothetical protein